MQTRAGHNTARDAPGFGCSSARHGHRERFTRKASIENPVCSQASMLAAATASSRPARLNQRTSLIRTRSVRVSGSPGVIGRDGKNATPALAPAVAPTLAASPVAVLINTPSVTHAPLHFAHEDPCDRGDGCGPFTEKPPQPLRHGNDPLPDGHRWDDVINQARGGLGHASAVTRGADAASLARLFAVAQRRATKKSWPQEPHRARAKPKLRMPQRR